MPGSLSCVKFFYTVSLRLRQAGGSGELGRWCNNLNVNDEITMQGTLYSLSAVSRSQ